MHLLLPLLWLPLLDYSDTRAVQRINSDLVNSIGNLLSRTTAPSVNKQQLFFPPVEDDCVLEKFLSEEDIKMYHSLQCLPGTCLLHLRLDLLCRCNSEPECLCYKARLHFFVTRVSLCFYVTRMSWIFMLQEMSLGFLCHKNEPGFLCYKNEPVF